MQTHRLHAVTLCAAWLGVCACASHTYAQKAGDYPSKPIRWIVASPSGGAPDVIARLVGTRLTDAWGQPVVLDFRPGAGTTIGTELAAHAAPDGHTLLFGQVSSLAINPTLMGKRLGFDPFRDFAPVSGLVAGAHLLVVNSTVPATSVQELIKVAKARPGQLSYASSGPGTSNHLGMELLKLLAGIDMVHVPYKGSTPGIIDTASGQVQAMLNVMPALLPHVKAGRLRGLAVSSEQRSAIAPEIPTVAEAGVPGFGYVAWFAMLAPARTPREIVGKLNAQVVRILAEPQTAKVLAAQGMEPMGTTPQGLTQLMREDTARWKKVIEAAHIRVD